MAEPPPYPGTPGWVKVFGLIFGVVVLLFAVLLLTRGAHHGPGDHTSSGDRHRSARVAEDHAPSEGPDDPTPPAEDGE